jgi:hypothetical protein
VTIKRIKHWLTNVASTILENLLLHLCRDPDEPLLINDIVDKYNCFRFMVRLHKDFNQLRGKRIHFFEYCNILDQLKF